MAVAILDPVLGAVGNIAGCLIEPIKRELGYMLCFNHNMNELETRLEQLKATKNDVQAREDAEQRSWKTLGEAANLWIVETNGKITEAENVISDKTELQKGCFSIKWCPNLKLRFSLGRKGKKLSLVLDHMLLRGHKLPQTGVALPVPPINMRDYYGDASNFDSRRKPMEDVIELLQDKETKLIGICGMGGIGKTTFAKQVLQKLRIPCLKELIIESIPNLKSLCNFCAPSLSELTIQNCEDFMYVFSFTSIIMNKNISQISKIHIEGCENLKGIVSLLIDLEEVRNKSVSFPNLQVLYLQFLGNLASFVINENKREKMQNALFYCDQVSLPCLQELFIYDLPKINYIVGWNRSQHYELEKGCNEDIQQTFFPILKEITLHSLTEFMSFVEDVDDDKEDNEEKQNTLSHRQLELPCLEKLNIYSIPNLTNLCNFNFNAPFLKELTIRDCEGLVYLFSATSVMKENISHLSELYVEECKKFKGIIFISTHPLEKRKESFSFPSLQELNLRWLDEFVSFVIVENEEEKMQSAQFYHNQVLFPYLRRLIISGLKKINYIVWLNNQEGEDYNKETLALTFPKLETLYLSHLMELVSFVGVSNDQDNGERQNSILFHPQHQVSFPYLKDLSIQDLPKISYIMGYGNDKHNESKLEPYLPFPILQELCLTDLSNLLHFYESNHPELGMLLFQNLSKLRISSCKKLKYLFSERIVRDACKHLESLDISSCSMLEVVMRKDDDDIIGGGESISLPNNHFFPVLGQLGLQYLKELKRFCDVADTWALSLLKRLNVYSCPKLEALSPGRLNSPKLETFKYNWRQKNTTGDINNILRHLFNRGDDDRDEEWGILAH